MKNKKIAKLLTRKDVRERYTREEAKQLFQWCIDKSSKDNPYPHSKEEIEKEIDIIYGIQITRLQWPDSLNCWFAGTHISG